MPNRSGQKELVVGKNTWIECYDVLIHGQNEEGEEISESFGLFRSAEKASNWAKAAYPGHKFTVLATMEDKRWARFKGPYKPK